MEHWVQQNLTDILGFSVPEDMAQYILKLHERDMEDYLNTLLDYTNAAHVQFVMNLKKQRNTCRDQVRSNATKMNVTSKKPQNGKKKGKAKGKDNTMVTQQIMQNPKDTKPEKVEKKKTKYVDLYSREGHDNTVVFLKGRHKCNCEAKKHALINNCLNCGRIVCKQEGSGPCFFCGQLVCLPSEQAIFSTNTKQASHLYNKLMDQKPGKGLQESVKQRDKLLEYDTNSARRTKVIDDESDYYQVTNVWLSATEREKLQKRDEEISALKHASRLNQKMTLDFAGRQVITENNPIDEYNDANYQDYLESESPGENYNVCPSIEFDRPIFIEQNVQSKKVTAIPSSYTIKNRIQDKEYLEITDRGFCLSLHQPYASLLVAGIKIHEGRSWYSSHRGRLWIASTSKVPTKEDISIVQNVYRNRNNENIIFPEHYPHSSLLGCVTIIDVLPQEEYRNIFPEGESESPYVFICENPYALPIKFPVQGKHKIYKLDSKIHYAVAKSLEKVMKVSRQAESFESYMV